MIDLSAVRQAAARSTMDGTRRFVIVVMVLNTVALVPVLLTVPIPDNARDVILALVGFFMAKSGDLINWLIGATQKSSERADRMADMHAATMPALAKPVVVEAPASVKVEPGAGDDDGELPPHERVER